MVKVVKNVKYNNVVGADREKIVLSSLGSQWVHSSQPHMLSCPNAGGTTHLSPSVSPEMRSDRGSDIDCS